jgi:hypothetical protein
LNETFNISNPGEDANTSKIEAISEAVDQIVESVELIISEQSRQDLVGKVSERMLAKETMVSLDFYQFLKSDSQ